MVPLTKIGKLEQVAVLGKNNGFSLMHTEFDLDFEILRLTLGKNWEMYT